MKLYLRYLEILFKSQLQYRASFILMTIGQFFVPLVMFASIYFLFEKFGQIEGWSFFEVALCFSIVHMSFAISVCFMRGFDSFSKLVVNAGFDRLLVRPRNTIVQVLGSNFEFTRLGRLIQSTMVLIWALLNISIEWNAFKVATLIFMLIGGIFIFSGIFILGASLCFFTVQGLELINIFTDGSREISQYPLSIYKDWVKNFFTFIVPLGIINYIPLMYLLGRGPYNDILSMLTPLIGIVFIIPCLYVWKFGVSKYLSAGS
ncbi:MAG TPA: hypothetical protein DEP72_03545 [Clostridiales bacterium]|nr:MAG: hypothetical protein A2Y18_00715 [Clostridiales bacterium GWD2_32_19]HCC07227.1 hypothetical protein [Clostridiales bacterium]